jgi:hypothetical protein
MKSDIPAIEMMRTQFARFNAVEAVRVDGGHGRAVWCLGIGEALNSTCLAKQVVDFMLVEEILGQVRLAGQKRELVPRREGQY